MRCGAGSFNGAVACWRRIAPGIEWTHSRRVASMGPSPVGDGKVKKGLEEGTIPAALQWGRRLLATESTSAELTDTGHTRSFNGAVACWRRKGGSYGCGQSILDRRFNGAVACWRRKAHWSIQDGELQIVLQWGRRLLATESTEVALLALAHWMLQWGRRLLATESREDQRGTFPLAGASMGPSPVGDGKDDRRVGLPAPVAASMGPSPVGDGKPGPRRWASAPRRASMGPSPVGDGKQPGDDG